MRTTLRLSLISLSISLALAACGGGGGGSTPSTSTESNSNGNPGGSTTTGSGNGSGSGTTTGSGNGSGTTTGSSGAPATVDASASMVMSCVDSPAAPLVAQCSGNPVLRSNNPVVDNGVALTNSGVEVYGKSTSDLQQPNPNAATATGFALASGGTAEMRLFKNTNGVVSNPQLLLKNLGIQWDGANERPTIAEIFLTTKGRVELTKDAKNRDVLTVAALPADPNFYTGTTQSNYANNYYAPTCPTGMTCPTIDSNGLQPTTAGNWQTGGTDPDRTSAGRLHEDGDKHAPTVPYPGTKGFRNILNYSYHYANLTKWVSQDTVEIAEWTNKNNEHNLNRRGIVAFGDVTAPADVPSAGTVTYKGWIYGWYASKSNIPGDPDSFHAEATVSVNFAARTVTLTVKPGTSVNDTTSTSTTPVSLPVVEFSATVPMGAAGSNVANYLNGTLTSGNLKGGIGGRFFGPIDTTATGGGSGPAEIGGSFSMSDAASGATVVGGFVAVKRTLP